MSEVNDIKAGKYQLVSARWDQITSKPSEPLDYVRHRRGDIVDLNSEDAKRLVLAGAVVKPGQLEKSRAEEARELAERAKREYDAILAGLPEDVRAEIAPDTVPVPDPVKEPAKVPTIQEIKDEVGEDKAKAAAALEAENARGDVRSTLVAHLEGLITAGRGNGGS